MDSDSIWKIVIIVVLIAISAFFSGAEAAFGALNRTSIKNLVFEGNKKAAQAVALAERYDRLLYTTLVIRYAADVAAVVLAAQLYISHSAHAARGGAAAFGIMTVALLLFAEIYPKTAAKNQPLKFALANVRLIRALVILLTPVRWIFMLWKKLVDAAFKCEEDRCITEEELINIVETAESEGGLDAEESELIRSAIEFGELEVRDILTPRVDVVAVEIGASREEVEAVFSEYEYTRLPVYDDSIDNVVGLINIKDFYNPKNKDKPLHEMLSSTVFVVPSMKISKILTVLQKEKSHMAIVTDEFGGTEGIVTMEDVLEQLVGEIWDEHDEVVEDFQKIGENEYLIRCSASVDKMFELFEIHRESDLPTVGGWVMEELGKIPVAGDKFTYENLLVEVTKTDPRRVLEIKVTVAEPQEDEE